MTKRHCFYETAAEKNDCNRKTSISILLFSLIVLSLDLFTSSLSEVRDRRATSLFAFSSFFALHTALHFNRALLWGFDSQFRKLSQHPSLQQSLGSRSFSLWNLNWEPVGTKPDLGFYSVRIVKPKPKKNPKKQQQKNPHPKNNTMKKTLLVSTEAMP